jgi:hypothetical protein
MIQISRVRYQEHIQQGEEVVGQRDVGDLETKQYQFSIVCVGTSLEPFSTRSRGQWIPN